MSKIDNTPNLDPSKLKLNFYKTTNPQYFYDSHLHPEYLDKELVHEYDEKASSKWFQPFMGLVNEFLSKYNIQRNIATVLGSSTGRCVFDLTNQFDQVIGVDFCGKFIEVAMQLQSKGKLELSLETDKNTTVRLDISNNLNASKAVFKQMTWIPNEIPKSDFVLFTMIDRVSNEICELILIFFFCSISIHPDLFTFLNLKLGSNVYGKPLSRTDYL